MRCTAKTKAGNPCRNTATEGGELCSVHEGKAHRPTGLTPEVQERILTAIRAGNYKTVAAQAAGIHPQTLTHWIERGEDPNGPEPFRSFFDAVQKAQGEGEARLVGLIAKAGRDTWTANAWLLERMYPDRWGRRERHEHTGAGGGPIAVRTEREVDRAIEELMEELERSQNGNRPASKR